MRGYERIIRRKIRLDQIRISGLDLDLEVGFPISVLLRLPPLFLPSSLSNPRPAVVVNIHNLVPPRTSAIVNAGFLYPRSILFDIFIVTATGNEDKGEDEDKDRDKDKDKDKDDDNQEDDDEEDEEDKPRRARR